MATRQFVGLNLLKQSLLLLVLLILVHVGYAQYEQQQEPAPQPSSTTKRPVAPPAPSPPPLKPASTREPVAPPSKTSTAPQPSKPVSTHEPTKLPPKNVKSTLPPSTAATKAVLASCMPNVLFVLDSTGSVSRIYDQQRRYILDIAQKLDISNESSHVGLVLYSSKERQEIVVELDKVPTKEQFLSTIEKLPFHGGVTATGAALTFAKTALEKRSANKKTVVLVLTDGFSFDDTKQPSDALRAVPGVQVLVVGNTDHVLRTVLEEIAGGEVNVLLGEANKSKVISALGC